MADDRPEGERAEDEREDVWFEERTIEERTVELRGVSEREGYPYLGDSDVRPPARPPAPPAPPPPPPAEKGGSRNKTIALALGALALVLAAIAVAWLAFGEEDTREVPTVEGLPLDEAVDRLQSEGFQVDVATEPNEARSGTVFAQDPGAGTQAEEGSTVRVSVSGGPDTISVPNAVGLPEAEARDRLVDAGFEVESTEVFSDREPGTVTTQSPSAGAQAEAGSTVTIEVSQGTGLVQVPNVVGLTRGEAEAELSNAQLEANVVEVPSDEPVGTVVAQSPVGGRAQQGSTVRLNVSAGRSS
jgi:eukaryotic-like serine/threonine-protein kinase